MTAQQRLIATARAEIGYLEKASNAQLDDKTANAGDRNWTKYARDLDALGLYNGPKNSYAWCDMFCDWCFVKTFGLEKTLVMTGQILDGYGAGCTESVRYYKNLGRFFTQNPQSGDQIFFSKDGGKSFYHTGLVEKVENGRVYTIEGNTSSAAGVVENGGCVRNKSYALSYEKIGGYGRPDYSVITEEEDNMDQATFDKMFAASMNKYRSDLRDNDSGSWSQEARDFAIREGLFAGNGTCAKDGQPNMMWEDFLTREQAAQLLYRFARKYGLHDDDLSAWKAPCQKEAPQRDRPSCRTRIYQPTGALHYRISCGGIDRRLLSCQREYSNRLYRRANVLDGGFYPNRDRGQSCAGENRDKEHDRKLRS